MACWSLSNSYAGEDTLRAAAQMADEIEKTKNKESFMSTLELSAEPLLAIARPKIRTLRRWIKKTADAFVEARVRAAVPEWQLRQARREMNRFQSMMNTRKRSAS